MTKGTNIIHNHTTQCSFSHITPHSRILLFPSTGPNGLNIGPNVEKQHCFSFYSFSIPLPIPKVLVKWCLLFIFVPYPFSSRILSFSHSLLFSPAGITQLLQQRAVLLEGMGMKSLHHGNS